MTRLDDKYDRAEDAVDFRPYETAQRLVLYHTVVEALVPGHGITDDDPERAAAEALEQLEHIASICMTELDRSGAMGAKKLRDRVRELAEEVQA